MNKKLGIGIVVVAIVVVLMCAGCIEEGGVPASTPTPTPTPTPPLNYDSKAVEKMDINVDWNSMLGHLVYPTVSLSFYDKYDREITKFNNGETNVIVVLIRDWERFGNRLEQGSKVIQKGEGIPKKLPFYGIDIGGVWDYIGVVVLLPDGRIANASIPIDRGTFERASYVSGYEAGESDARKGYSAEVSILASKNYREGYYDGYGGFTPRHYVVGEPKKIMLSSQIPEPPKSWHPVNTFSGKDKTTTNSFTIQGDIWRVFYTISGSNKESYVTSKNQPKFHFYLHRKGGTNECVGDWEVAVLTDSRSSTVYLFNGSGDYYFEIDAINLVSYSGWKLEVEEYY